MRVVVEIMVPFWDPKGDPNIDNHPCVGLRVEGGTLGQPRTAEVGVESRVQASPGGFTVDDLMKVYLQPPL